jgi:hypothetical protein
MAGYLAGDPVSWIGSAGQFDRPLTVDRAWSRGGRPLYDLAGPDGKIVIFAVGADEIMPALVTKDGA